MKKIILILFLLLTIFVSIGIAKEITVIFDYPTGTDFNDTIIVNEDANAYTVVTLVANNNSIDLNLGYFDGMGYYVNGINEFYPGDNEYWGFFTNYQSASEGISTHIPEDKEIISFSIIDFSYSQTDYNFIVKNNSLPINSEIYLEEIYLGSTQSNGILELNKTFMPGTYNIKAIYENEELIQEIVVDGLAKEISFNFYILGSENNQIIDDAINWIVSNQDSNGQIGNGAVWGNAFSLMALSLFNDNNLVKEKAINYLLSNQKDDAGFAYPGYSSDAVHTAVSNIALISNNKNLEDFDINDITTIDYLKTKQENDGGFSGFGSSDNDTTAWSTIAFASTNISLPIKNSISPLEFMQNTQNSDGGFPYSIDQESSIDYTSEVLIALASQKYQKDSIVNNAINYLKNNIDSNGCVDNAYKTSIVSLALNAYGEEINSLNNCIESMQKSNGGFSRNDVSNSTDTSLAILALKKATFPIIVLEKEDNNGVVGVHSTIEFVLTITNNGRVSAKNVDISLSGIDSSWIKEELSDLFISEIKAGQTINAKIYVEMKEVGNYEINANLNGEGISTIQSSNLLPIEIKEALLNITLEMN